ncbi:MAG: alpha-ketoacid dehydrogenase subunit beta [Simkaniaceae bacterium]|nr:alpha-ketoacid dehydrogenase subunit beta [Simkaniaceae bacterium]
MIEQLTFAEALLQAADQALAIDPNVLVMGLGVPDPKGIFGTTTGLQNKYGKERVLDIPCSENGMTGIAIGAAILGMRPILTHQRVDFALLSLDQIINNASKWHYMFGGEMKVPLVIRLIIGRGWGQGPQHSQTLHSLFAHIPGLKVVMPSSPYDAKGLLLSAIADDNPVIFIEHRWLHNIHGPVPKEMYTVPLGKGKILQEGTDVTIVAASHMTIEAYRALPLLKEQGISAELIDLRSILPFDKDMILQSVRKTGRLVVADPDWKTGGFAAEVITSVVETTLLKCPPQRVCYPDRLIPSSPALAEHFYPSFMHLASTVLQMMGCDPLPEQVRAAFSDVPDKSFTGPF